MKGKVGIIIGATVLALGAGFYTYQSNADSVDPIQKVTEVNEESLVHQEQKQEFISEDEAKEIALNEFQGNIVDFELDEDDGRWIYEIELIDGQYEAEFDVDAITGEIIKKDMEWED